MRAGASGSAAVTRYVRNLPSSAIVPVTPANLVNFGEAVNFPAMLGVVLLIFGAATLVHLLVVSVVRRRRELGLLKAIGFTGRQAAASVSWQATTVAVVGIIVGVPVGLIVGRAVWRVFATNVGVVPDPVVLAWELVAVSFGTLVVANVLAIGPSVSSSRARPGPLLRAE
jgi:ABC-type antimicrobial peptide transport system permease subunit